MIMTANRSVSKIKAIARTLAARGYTAAGGHKRANIGRVIILMYHRVLKDNDDYAKYLQPGMFVFQSSFEMHVQSLLEDYDVISFDEMLRLQQTGTPERRSRCCVITFDDGWRDNYDFALPILRKYRLPATVFLTTGYAGTERSFWHEDVSRLFFLFDRAYGSETPCARPVADVSPLTHLISSHLLLKTRHRADSIDTVVEALKSHPAEVIEGSIHAVAAAFDLILSSSRTMLSWDEIRDMGLAGISFGSHTCEHQLLTQVDDLTAQREIRNSLADLRSQDLNLIPAFCYPNGFHNRRIRELVADAGYSAAVTTSYGSESPELPELFQLARIGIHQDISKSRSLFFYRIRGGTPRRLTQ